MALLEPVSQYYKLTFNSNGTGGSFDFAVLVAMNHAYTGDGSEFGSAVASGADQIAALAAGIASGLETHSAPNWDNITLLKIEINPSTPDQIFP